MMLPKRTYVSPNMIAGWFVNHSDREAGDVVTHLKVQKLCYYADAWFLANFDRPLIAESFEAWAHGPVSPTVWKKYRGSGWDPLDPEKGILVPPTIIPFLGAIYDEYGKYSAKKLEELSHSEEPWIRARGDISKEAHCSNPIDRLLTRNFYASRLGKEPANKLSH